MQQPAKLLAWAPTTLSIRTCQISLNWWGKPDPSLHYYFFFARNQTLKMPWVLSLQDRSWRVFVPLARFDPNSFWKLPRCHDQGNKSWETKARGELLRVESSPVFWWTWRSNCSYSSNAQQGFYAACKAFTITLGVLSLKSHICHGSTFI